MSALGIGLLVLPAPAFMVIPAGLAILALEFAGRGLREARELGRGDRRRSRVSRALWLGPKLPRDPYLDCPRVGLTSSPAVEGERVYLMNNRAEIMALDLHGLANGNDGPFHDESRHAAPFATEPAALGPLDGDILWLTDLRKELEVYPHDSDSANISVLVVGDHLYVSTPNGVDRGSDLRYGRR